MPHQKKYLVDTNILIDALQGQKQVSDFVRQLLSESKGNCYITDVTIAELYAGINPDRTSEANVLLQIFPFVSPTAEAAKETGRYMYIWARKGLTLGLGDALLAGLAKTATLALVTRNKKHFPMDDIEIISP